MAQAFLFHHPPQASSTTRATATAPSSPTKRPPCALLWMLSDVTTRITNLLFSLHYPLPVCGLEVLGELVLLEDHAPLLLGRLPHLHHFLLSLVLFVVSLAVVVVVFDSVFAHVVQHHHLSVQLL